MSDDAPGLEDIGLDNYAPYLMNRIMGRYNAALQGEMTTLGLTTAHMRSLATLAVKDGILIRELAVYAVIEQSTLSRSLEALVKSGLIRREADATDNRATRLFLTQAGRETYERLWPHMTRARDAMFQGISEADQRAFIATLQIILRNIRQNDF